MNENIKELLKTKPYYKFPECLGLHMDSSGLKRGAVVLYRSLYDICLSNVHNRKNLSCRVSREKLGDRIKRTPKTITRLTKYLEAEGYLIVKRFFSGEKKSAINEYWLTIPDEVMNLMRQSRKSKGKHPCHPSSNACLQKISKE